MSKKDPIAVQIGQRMQQARNMANVSSIKKLIAHDMYWKDKGTRIGNYEAGFSRAPQEIILFYEKLTGCSATWIFFGTGPIRPDGRDIQAIRHQNFTVVFETFKTARKLKQLYTSLGLSQKKVSDYLNNPFKTISDITTRKTEKLMKKKNGWMDEQHIENDPVFLSLPKDLVEIISMYSDLSSDQQTLFRNVMQQFKT